MVGQPTICAQTKITFSNLWDLRDQENALGNSNKGQSTQADKMDLKFKYYKYGDEAWVRLTNVLFVPQAGTNLHRYSAWMKNVFKSTWVTENVLFTKIHDGAIGTPEKGKDGQYWMAAEANKHNTQFRASHMILNDEAINTHLAKADRKESTQDLREKFSTWHQRIGQVNKIPFSKFSK